MGLEPRGRADQGQPVANPAGEELAVRPGPKVKSFEIDKRLVYRAWEKVRANKGAPGVDAVSIAGFGEQERDNLYRLWNRIWWETRAGARGGDTEGSSGWGCGCPLGAPLTRQTGWRRPRQRCCWKKSWSRSSTATVTVTVRGEMLMTRWP